MQNVIFLPCDTTSLIVAAELIRCMQIRHSLKFEDFSFYYAQTPYFKDGMIINDTFGIPIESIPDWSNIYLINFPLSEGFEKLSANFFTTLAESGILIKGILSWDDSNWDLVFREMINPSLDISVLESDNPWHALNLAFDDEGNELDGSNSRRRREAANAMYQNQRLDGFEVQLLNTIRLNTSHQVVCQEVIEAIRIIAETPLTEINSKLYRIQSLLWMREGGNSTFVAGGDV